MNSNCERCAGPIDGSAYRRSRVRRCVSCSKVCRRCDRNPIESPFWVCRSCWPRCERCGSELPSKGRRTTRIRCDACVDLCRQCDSPIERGSDPERRKKLCDACSGKCTKCGGPGPGRSGACSPCRQAAKRLVETEARAALGNACRRCGIAYPLHWDHVNDDPPRRGETVKRGSVLATEYREIRSIAETGRSDRLQLLCPNCNYLKQYDRAAYDEAPRYGPLG